VKTEWREREKWLRTDGQGRRDESMRLKREEVSKEGQKANPTADKKGTVKTGRRERSESSGLSGHRGRGHFEVSSRQVA
jgi:hypothetical protein